MPATFRLAVVLGAVASSLACASTSDTPASAGDSGVSSPHDGGANTGGAGATGSGAGPSGAGGGGPSGGDVSGGGTPSLPLFGPPIVFVSGTGSDHAIWAYDLDAVSGELVKRAEYDGGANPSYLTLNRTRTQLYASNADDSAEGGVTAFSIGDDGALTLLNHQTGSDGGFAHLALSPSGKWLLAASFSGGSVSVFPVGADGSVAAQSLSLDFGAGAEAHCVAFDRTGEQVLVPTRGNDQVQQLRLTSDGALVPNSPAFASTAAGAGPRHIVIHPDGMWAFVVNEADSTAASYALSAQGTLTAATAVSTLPGDFTGENTGAHIELSPDGRFVYVSNRGHDSIAVFTVDPSNGTLSLLEHESSRGQTPRDFDVDAQGQVLIVANQESDTLSVYAIEEAGTLTPLGSPVVSPPSPRAVQIHYLPPLAN